MTTETFPLDRLGEIQASPENFRCIERVPFTRADFTLPASFPQTGKDYPFVILDVETTGLSHTTDKIIELGIVTGRVSLEHNRITEITGAYSLYQDPGFPITEEITALTGITNEMVAGQHIDTDLVASLINRQTLVIAHNAGFDRPFFETWITSTGSEKLLPALEAPWMCSINDIPWSDLGFKSRSLEVLLLTHGYFYEAHRASIDALATAWLLHTNQDALKFLLENGQQTTCHVQATSSPFSTKDALKARGYSWDGDAKVWGIVVPERILQEELDALDALYGGGKNARITRKKARERYKAAA
jgi:DNA polymerase-3 subunit epsilon